MPKLRTFVQTGRNVPGLRRSQLQDVSGDAVFFGGAGADFLIRAAFSAADRAHGARLLDNLEWPRVAGTMSS